jgi:hypothetical protein
MEEEKKSCEKCGKTMKVKSSTIAKYTIFTHWECGCGHTFLQKQHTPIIFEEDNA